MRKLSALALALCIAAAGPVQAQQAEVLPGRCRCGAAQKHNFGMDWGGEPAGQVNRLLPDLTRCVELWSQLPARLERAFWWGGCLTGVVGLVVLEGAGVLVYLLWRKP